MSTIKQDERWRRSVGSRVIVDGRGGGVLEYYGLIKKSGQFGKKMCGVCLDQPLGECTARTPGHAHPPIARAARCCGPRRCTEHWLGAAVREAWHAPEARWPLTAAAAAAATAPHPPHTPTAGRNDGSVNGRQYFACEQDYGLFVPAFKVTLESEYNTTKMRQLRSTCCGRPGRPTL